MNESERDAELDRRLDALKAALKEYVDFLEHIRVENEKRGDA